MRYVFLALSIALSDTPEVSPTQVCADEYATCKDGCSMDYGTSLNEREKLGRCLVRCDKAHDHCPEWFLEAHRKKVEAAAARDAGSPKVDGG